MRLSLQSPLHLDPDPHEPESRRHLTHCRASSLRRLGKSSALAWMILFSPVVAYGTGPVLIADGRSTDLVAAEDGTMFAAIEGAEDRSVSVYRSIDGGWNWDQVFWDGSEDPNLAYRQPRLHLVDSEQAALYVAYAKNQIYDHTSSIEIGRCLDPFAAEPAFLRVTAAESDDLLSYPSITTDATTFAPSTFSGRPSHTMAPTR